jgi:hypothetical protein
MTPGQIIYQALFPKWDDLSGVEKKRWNKAARDAIAVYAGQVEGLYASAIQRVLPEVEKKIKEAGEGEV